MYVRERVCVCVVWCGVCVCVCVCVCVRERERERERVRIYMRVKKVQKGSYGLMNIKSSFNIKLNEKTS